MSNWDPQVKELFLEALKLSSPAQRAAFLAQACAEKPELRARVVALLEAHEQAGTFLEAPATATMPDRPVAERAGTVIGPYKLLEQIGEGGFGIVYMAEQDHPIRRRVAVKIIKPGMDTRQIIARFEAERQALALMDHPNIARVFDAGETATGRPYFVMELVKGVPITSYCDQNRLPLRQRLELFIHVCNAVQHAHHKGIVHRDIKPSNILVALHDGEAVVKIIDFGIAKAMGQALTDKTVFTGFAQILGTPLYASPEQVIEGGLDIDTRTDVYSLGVLLYELLTGCTPFEKERLKNAAYDEMRRIIRDEDPPRPSTRITTLGETSTVIAAQRASLPKRLAQLFRGELDWIVMKALEKNRTRRYDTPQAFAGDVARYLANQPVEARPPTAAYKMSKFVKRHTWGSAVAAASVLLLGLSTTLIWNEKHQTDRALEITKTALADAKQQRDLAGRRENEARQSAIRAEKAEETAKQRLEEANVAATRAREAESVAVAAAERERQARGEAEEQRLISVSAEAAAEKQARRATAASEFLTGVLSSTERNKSGGNDVKVADLLDDAAKGLAEKLQGQPELEIEIRYVLGTSYDSLRLTDKACGQWRTAYQLVPSLAPEDADYALVKVASALALAETQEEGLRLLNEAQEAAARIYEPTSREARELEARRGVFWIKHDKVADGKAFVQGLLDWADANPDDVTTAERIAWLNTLAQAEVDPARAQELRRQAELLAGSEKTPRPGFDITGVITGVVDSVRQLMDHEKYAEARDQIEKSLPDIQARLSPMDPNVLNIIGQYQAALLGTGEYQKRLKFMQDRADRLQSMQKAGQINLTAAEQAQLDCALADAYWLAGQDKEAHERYVQALQAISKGAISKINTLVASNINTGPISNINAGGGNQWNAGLVWYWAMIQEGLGREDAWTTPALRAQVGILLGRGFGKTGQEPPGLPMDARWDTLKFKLRQWTSEQPHLKPIADGAMEKLRSLRLPGGQYLLELEFERANQPLEQLASWITIVPFHAALYPAIMQTPGGSMSSTPRNWYETKTTAPLVQRVFPSVAIAAVVTRNAGPGGRTTYFALTGTATLRLPPGNYRIVVSRDAGVRVNLDRRRVIDAWSATTGAEEVSEEVALDAGDHALRVDYFKGPGPFRLWLRFEPADPEATDALKPSKRTSGLASLTNSPQSALQTNPRNVSAWLSLGSAYARYGYFERAADDFDSALKIVSESTTPAPGRGTPAASASAPAGRRGAAPSTRPAGLAAAAAAAQQSYTPPNDFAALWRSAYSHLQAGHLTEYEDRCQELFRRYGTTTNFMLKEELADICVLGPSAIDGKQLETLLDFDSDAKQPAELAAWSHLARGRVNYRNGNWTKSTDELSRSLAYELGPYAHAGALFFLAMANEKMGDHDQALAYLKKATAYADSEIASEAGWTDLGSYWVVWIMESRARQEAETLFGLKPATRAATQPTAAPRP